MNQDEATYAVTIGGLEAAIQIGAFGSPEKTTAERVRLVGGLLVQAKRKMYHGEWLPWLRGNCGFTPRTAQRHMKAYAKGERGW